MQHSPHIPSLYSLVTHNHQLPPHLPTNSQQIPTSHPCCFLPLNPLFSLFLLNSIKSKKSASCSLSSSRPCLNIDRDWNPCWLLSHIRGGQRRQSFCADFITGAENCKYESIFPNTPPAFIIPLHAKYTVIYSNGNGCGIRWWGVK